MGMRNRRAWRSAPATASARRSEQPPTRVQPDEIPHRLGQAQPPTRPPGRCGEHGERVTQQVAGDGQLVERVRVDPDQHLHAALAQPVEMISAVGATQPSAHGRRGAAQRGGDPPIPQARSLADQGGPDHLGAADTRHQGGLLQRHRGRGHLVLASRVRNRLCANRSTRLRTVTLTTNPAPGSCSHLGLAPVIVMMSAHTIGPLVCIQNDAADSIPSAAQRVAQHAHERDEQNDQSNR